MFVDYCFPDVATSCIITARMATKHVRSDTEQSFPLSSTVCIFFFSFSAVSVLCPPFDIQLVRHPISVELIDACWSLLLQGPSIITDAK